MRRAVAIGVAVLAASAAHCAYPKYAVDDSLGEGGSGASTAGASGAGGAAAGAAGGSGIELAPAPPVSDCVVGGDQMIPLPGGYCIDPTEVTTRDYSDWLGTMPMVSSPPPPCDQNLQFEPDQGCLDSTLASGMPSPLDDPDRLPVTCVDWCDARQFCESQSKHLCGSIGELHSPTGHADFADATRSQWFNACSVGGQHDYPYGDEYDATACYTETQQEMMLSVIAREVGALTDCQASEADYAGVMDLSGNVEEWVDECDEQTGCRTRGGAHYVARAEASANTRCDASASHLPEFRSPTLGFRCCYTPPSP